VDRPNLSLPDDLAGSRIERDKVSVVRGDEKFVPEERAVAIRAGQDGRMLYTRTGIFPDERPVACVQRFYEIAGLWQEHDSVVDERRRFLQARFHRPRPGETEVRDVRRIDLIERAVAPVIVGPPPCEPSAVRWIEQHGLADRRVALAQRLCARNAARDSERCHQERRESYECTHEATHSMPSYAEPPNAHASSSDGPTRSVRPPGRSLELVPHESISWP
jgi:hypothetical protein